MSRMTGYVWLCVGMLMWEWLGMWLYGSMWACRIVLSVRVCKLITKASRLEQFITERIPTSVIRYKHTL